MAKGNSPSISELASAVVDNGRRGMPKPGCDCEQCFGYCLVDSDEAQRAQWKIGGAAAPVQGAGTLNFSDEPITA